MAKSKALQKRHIQPKPVKPEKLTPEKVAKALTLSGGLVATSARKLKVARSTVYDYIEKYESVQEALTEAREFTLDLAESQLLKAVKRGEAWSITFLLKTVGQTRGYSEKPPELPPATNRLSDDLEAAFRKIYGDDADLNL